MVLLHSTLQLSVCSSSVPFTFISSPLPLLHIALTLSPVLTPLVSDLKRIVSLSIKASPNLLGFCLFPWAYSVFCASHYWACLENGAMLVKAKAEKKELNNKNNSLICIGSSFLNLQASQTEETFANLFISCGECPRPRACNEIKLPPYLTTLLTKRKQVSEGKAGQSGRLSWIAAVWQRR